MSESEIIELKSILYDDGKINEFLYTMSQLYTSYGVRDKEGKFRNVIDMDSVIELMKNIFTHTGMSHREAQLDIYYAMCSAYVELAKTSPKTPPNEIPGAMKVLDAINVLVAMYPHLEKD